MQCSHGESLQHNILASLASFFLIATAIPFPLLHQEGSDNMLYYLLGGWSGQNLHNKNFT